MLGYPPEQVIGKNAHALFHHSRADGLAYPVGDCPSHGTLRSGDVMRVDDEVYWKADGQALPVMYSVHPMVKDGEVLGAVISFIDASAQRAAAQAREKAVLAAETLARSRREFLANMSHEIRTPLNGVLGFAQIGRRSHHDSEKARQAFEKILASGNLLLGVINDILDYSKIEAGKLSVERTTVLLGRVVEQAVDVVRERAEAKGINLRMELLPGLPVRVMGDPLRIGQVLLNLLSNAVKFTAVGSVTLSVSAGDDRLRFTVRDTGVGIAGEHLGRLFDPFQQADGSTSRRFGGTGLGLAISKRLAELMGGDIRVDSVEGSGSTFEFVLPLIPA
jgi:signal transduction histidine kinase